MAATTSRTEAPSASRPLTWLARCCTLGRTSSSGSSGVCSWAQSGARVCADGGDGALVLVPVLGGGEQGGAAGEVVGGAVPRGVVPGQDEGLDLLAGAADEQLGGGADEPGAGEGVALGVAAGQAGEQQADVDGVLGGGGEVAGEHDLLQFAVADAPGGAGHDVLPRGRGQAAVAVADRGRGRASGVKVWCGASPMVVSQARPSLRARMVWGTTRTEPGEFSSKVKVPKATGPLPGAARRRRPWASPKTRGEPLAGPGEAVRDRGDVGAGGLAPADEALAVPDPGVGRGLGQRGEQVTGVATGVVRTSSGRVIPSATLTRDTLCGN